MRSLAASLTVFKKNEENRRKKSTSDHLSADEKQMTHHIFIFSSIYPTFLYSMTNFCLMLLALMRKATSSERGSSSKQFWVEKVMR